MSTPRTSHGSDHKSNHSIRPGVVLSGGYELIECIGKGSFSEIFSAVKQSDRSIVAVKIQAPDFDASVLKWEGTVMQALSDTNCVPRFYAMGQYERRDYIVMELLTGEDMTSLRNRVRNANPTGLVPLPVVVHLACEIVNCLQDMHRKGYVHRDVKPSNFVRKSAEGTKFCAIDFGLVKQYLNIDGTVKAKKDRAEFRGTTIYASPMVHDGQDQCPRDDLCSMLHVFLDMACGKLPWGDSAKQKEKAIVASIKRKCYEDVDWFMDWEVKQVMAAEAGRGLPSSNFPPRAQENCRVILAHLKGLDYESVPDYELIRNLLRGCVEEPDQHNVSDFSYTLPYFSWKSSEKAHRQASQVPLVQLPSAGSSSQPADPQAYQVRNLITRIQALQRKDAAQLPSPEEQYSIAMRWQNLVKELDKLPESKFDLKLLEEYGQVLIQNQHFFGMGLGPEEQKWTDFTKLQEVMSDFYALSMRVRKRRREEMESGTQV